MKFTQTTLYEGPLAGFARGCLRLAPDRAHGASFEIRAMAGEYGEQYGVFKWPGVSDQLVGMVPDDEKTTRLRQALRTRKSVACECRTLRKTRTQWGTELTVPIFTFLMSAPVVKPKPKLNPAGAPRRIILE